MLTELAAQLTNMFALVLVGAAAVTFAMYALTTPRDTANLELSLGILGVVFLNAAIGFAQEHAAERTAEALQAMVPANARVVRDGELTEIPAADLVPGDVVVLDAGDAVSADGRLVEAHGMLVEMAALTGESRPTPRIAEAVKGDLPVAEARNCALMGTSVINGRGRAVVFATGLASEFGRIYRLTAEQPPEQSPLQRQVTVMARRVAAVAIGTGAALFALRAAISHVVVGSFVFALGVMVALVPEGLPATMSVSLAVAVRRMARRHALIKRLPAVEALGSTTVICTDKTGTLTRAEMTVQVVWEPGRRHEVTGVGYEPKGTVSDPTGAAEVLRVAALCSDARLLPPDRAKALGWRILGDTTEGAIVVAARKAGLDLTAEEGRVPRVGTFPFDPDRKLMTTVHRVGAGHEAYVKGSPQAVLERCVSMSSSSGDEPLENLARTRIAAANDELAAQGLRVLAVARRELCSALAGAEEAELGLTFLGLVAMSDPPRPEVVDAVHACRHAGIRIYMITGDYGLTAEAIARRVGIVSAGAVRVVTGADLDDADDEQLASLLAGDEQVLFAGARPEHKLRIVAALQGRGEVVAVTGDGVNDAPALKRASIGVSMGEGGTDARAASVMILLDDSFASIAAAVELGRAVYQNIRKFLVYLFSHNLAELAPILAAVFVGFPLVPLSALQVLAIDLGSDVMPALALGTEAPEPGAMDHPPRPVREHLFNWTVVRRFLFLGGIQSAGVVFAFFWRIHSAHLAFGSFTTANPTYREALTMTQAGIVVSQFFNSFAVRTEEQSIFKVGLLSNVPLVLAGGVGLAFMCCVSYLPPMNDVFHTAPLRVSDWLILVAMGAMLLAAEELRKTLRRAARRRQQARERGGIVQVLIIGCGRTGSALATRLQGDGDDVAVVDVESSARERLSQTFGGRFVNGSGVARETLERAGIAEAESCVALTANDNVNAVAARVARDVYRVPRVLARLHEPARAHAYRELGIPTIGSVETTVNRVVRYLHHAALQPHHTFGNDETVLVRGGVPSYLAGRPAGELEVPGEIRVVEISRRGHSRVPDATSALEEGDVVSFVVAAGSIGRLRSFLDGRWE